MIYLDSAATSFQKPPNVHKAVAEAICKYASPGRGDHRVSFEASEKVYEVRLLIAAYFGLKNESGVIFTSNATHALNIAIKGFTFPGDEVVVSCLEHNAVVRPIVTEGRRMKVANFPASDPQQAVYSFKKTITTQTRCVVCTMVSNVFGCILLCMEIGKMCREMNIPFVIDASQAAGSLSINALSSYADAICMPGHKGLLGPQGTGLLLLPSDRYPRPLIEGGTGSMSAQYRQPPDLPDRYESGTQNVPGILGLAEGVKYIQQRGEEAILSKERGFIKKLYENLDKKYIFPCGWKADTHVGLIAIQHKSLSCDEVARNLSKDDIAVRSGLCCAPLAHNSQNTFARGIVRISVSDFNTEEEVDTVIEKLSRM